MPSANILGSILTSLGQIQYILHPGVEGQNGLSYVIIMSTLLAGGVGTSRKPAGRQHRTSLPQSRRPSRPPHDSRRRRSSVRGFGLHFMARLHACSASWDSKPLRGLTSSCHRPLLRPTELCDCSPANGRREWCPRADA